MSRVLGNGHALVLRGARHSNVSGLPVQRRSPIATPNQASVHPCRRVEREPLLWSGRPRRDKPEDRMRWCLPNERVDRGFGGDVEEGTRHRNGLHVSL